MLLGNKTAKSLILKIEEECFRIEYTGAAGALLVGRGGRHVGEHRAPRIIA